MQFDIDSIRAEMEISVFRLQTDYNNATRLREVRDDPMFRRYAQILDVLIRMTRTPDLWTEEYFTSTLRHIIETTAVIREWLDSFVSFRCSPIFCNNNRRL